MSEITDLDVLLPEPKQVRLQGEVYLVPGDLPTPLYLRIHELGVAIGNATTDEPVDEIGDLYGELLDLFRVHQPDLETLPLSLPQLLRLVPMVYGGEAADVDPPAPPASRPRTTRSKAATTRRSASPKSSSS